MVQNEEQPCRQRGRPQKRSDAETRDLLILAADARFAARGFCASSVADIAGDASVSTKTLYRLFPKKEDLLADVITRRMSGLVDAIDRSLKTTEDVHKGLVRILTAYGMLTLSDNACQMTRLVAEEAGRLPGIATAFYERAIVPTDAAIEAWLKDQCARGSIGLEDPRAASGMLRGMMIMEPQRSVLFKQAVPLSEDEIVARATMCADRFLRGFGARRDGRPHHIEPTRHRMPDYLET